MNRSRYTFLATGLNEYQVEHFKNCIEKKLLFGAQTLWDSWDFCWNPNRKSNFYVALAVARNLPVIFDRSLERFLDWYEDKKRKGGEINFGAWTETYLEMSTRFRNGGYWPLSTSIYIFDYRISHHIIVLLEAIIVRAGLARKLWFDSKKWTQTHPLCTCSRDSRLRNRQGKETTSVCKCGKWIAAVFMETGSCVTMNNSIDIDRFLQVVDKFNSETMKGQAFKPSKVQEAIYVKNDAQFIQYFLSPDPIKSYNSDDNDDMFGKLFNAVKWVDPDFLSTCSACNVSYPYQSGGDSRNLCQRCYEYYYPIYD
jgi:hypothetical protein